MLLMFENLQLNSLQKILKYFIYEFVYFKILCEIKQIILMEIIIKIMLKKIMLNDIFFMLLII